MECARPMECNQFLTLRPQQNYIKSAQMVLQVRLIHEITI